MLALRQGSAAARCQLSWPSRIVAAVDAVVAAAVAGEGAVAAAVGDGIALAAVAAAGVGSVARLCSVAPKQKEPFACCLRSPAADWPD